jgi:RecA-family ATPase
VKNVTNEELSAARLAPACIVDRYLYADVALLVAPGKTGKTTLLLYEAVHIVLGLPLYGLDVKGPGNVLIITAEDPRERLVARLREVMNSLSLDDEQRWKVTERIQIWDVSGSLCRLAEMDEDNNVVLTGLADHIIERCKGDPPVMVAFDPAINFGAGERLVNDNEQALILAARRIVRSLGCCVRIVHHTGKANAREQTTDQYSARGGSALPDGARMTVVVQSYNPEKSKQELPPGFAIRKPEEEQVLFMSRTISYAPANLPMIWLKRIGYAFEYMVENRVSAEERQRAYADQIENFLTAQLKLTPRGITVGAHWKLKS